MRGSEVIAEGRPTSVELDVPEPLSFEEATERVTRYVGFQGHVFPTCFVCGPDRAEGDGLRIFPGRNEADAFVAAPWIPHAADGNASGLVRPAILWAALDCPGYFGAAAGEMALLGRMAADVRADVPVDTRCIVLGWKLGAEGRKVFAATALFSEGGELLGKARQTWIVLSR